MYKLLLVRKYLRRKLAPLFAVLAVMLCTAMVIIVISVMGGFLDMMRQSAQKLTGQVTVRSDLVGFPHHEQMLKEIRSLGEVGEATAVIRAYGLVNLRDMVLTTEVLGIDPASLTGVTGYNDTLYWTPRRLHQQRPVPIPSSGTNLAAIDPLIWGQPANWFLQQDWLGMGKRMLPTPEVGGDSGVVLGIEVSPFNQRDSQGQYTLINTSLGAETTVTVLPLSQRGSVLEPAVRRLTVVNEFKSGLFEVDANRIYVDFNLLQQMLKMDPVPRVDPETGMPTGEMIPGRVSEIMIRGSDGVSLHDLHAAVESTVYALRKDLPDLPLMWVETWEQRHERLLGAVEKEKGLLTILFGIISIVAVAMIGVIFYMIVLEKTRDIGVLRALGASRAGVMGIFLTYGLGIGLVGSGLGTTLAASVVWNLNEIQNWLYEFLLWVSQGAIEFKMWDPRVYYFDRIPNRLDPFEVVVIVVCAVVSSVLGSLVPAYSAGRVDPVESLRYE